MTERTAYVTEHDLHYLRSILGHLREARRFINNRQDRFQVPTLGGEVLSDNIDWLDCFIDKHGKRP